MPRSELPFPPGTFPPSTALTIFRYSDYDTPFWDRANTRPGRWHHLGAEATQYWSLSPEAAWAELIRWEELTSEAELEEVRKPMWVSRVKPGLMLDLRRTQERENCGVSEAQLVADDHRPCRDLGGVLREHYSLILTPSAALDGHTNVTIFGKRRMSDWRLPAPTTRTLPAAVVAVGRPPGHLLSRVRRFGPGPIPDRLFDPD